MSHGSRLGPGSTSQRSQGGTKRVRPSGCVAATITLTVAAALLVGLVPSGEPLDLLGSAPAAAAPAAAPSSPGPVSSGSYDPAVSFTALEHPVGFWQRIFSASEPTQSSHGQIKSPAATFTFSWFGEVVAERRSEDLDLAFAVEHQHNPSGYQFCESPDACADVNVRVTPEGLLYLQWQRAHFDFGYFADFPARTVELSAADPGTPMKVYREVLVGPPTAATGCEEYGENNPDAYACLFLRELIPEGIGDTSKEAALRASLPGLVQPATNYNLVFSEDFDGTLPAANAAGCTDGLSTLDNDLWSYRDACDNLDSRGETCGNIVGGQLVIAQAGTCHIVKVSTHGNLHVKYGYFEVKFTLNMNAWAAYHNYNVILYARGEKLRYLLDRYGVNIDDYEDYLTNIDTEIDMVEYDVNGRSFIGHQFANFDHRFVDPDIPPTSSSKWYTFCGQAQDLSIINNPNRPCSNANTFTVTLGTEWTPRGYRTFINVDEFGDGMFVVPKDQIAASTKPSRTEPHQRLTGDAKDAYFEYLDPDDTDTLLEKVAVSHVPLPLNIGAWGYLDSDRHPFILSRMKIDYIRVWQPDNHYSTMEPVYQ